jgi:LysR family nod box-dependent transcriptional activator
MNFQQLDLNLLVALDALLAERNITEAGRRVHLSQSAMSGALGRLREYFEDELLVQVGRKMVLTTLAVGLVEPVRDILSRARTTIAMRPTFDPGTSRRRFSLMMSDYVSTVLMTDVLRTAEQLAPRVEFEIVSNDVSNPSEVLERADVDLLIMPPAFLSRAHPNELLFSDDYACVVWSENSRVGERISPEQYLELGHVALQFGRRMPAIEDFFLTRQGLNRRVEVIAMNFNAVPLSIVGTHRIATVQRRLAEFYVRYLPLRALDPPLEIPRVLESMQWHTAFDRDPASVWLRTIIRQLTATEGSVQQIPA